MTRGTLVERRAQDLRLHIAETALRLFVADGDTSATVERIVEAAGVAPRTFYRHFAVKEDVVVPLFQRSSASIAAALRSADPHQSPATVLVAAFSSELDGSTLSPENRAFLGLMMTNPQYRMRWMAIDGELREEVAALLDRHFRWSDVYLRELAAELVAHAARRAFESYLSHPEGAEVDVLLRRGVELVLSGLATVSPQTT